MCIRDSSKPGGVAKVDLATFEEIGSATHFLQGEDNVWSLIMHGDILYAGLDTRPGKIVRLDRNLRRLDTVGFGETGGGVYAFVPSGESLICGLYSSPGMIALVQTQPPKAEPSFLWLMPILASIILVPLILLLLRKTRIQRQRSSPSKY